MLGDEGAGFSGPSSQPQEAAPRFLRPAYVCDSNWRTQTYPLSLTIVVSICLGLFLLFPPIAHCIYSVPSTYLVDYTLKTTI